MSKSVLSAVIRSVRRVAQLDSGGPSATDGQHLSQFAAHRDPGAFAALVDRLGPMVLAICRRVVGDVHLADDAFQATFLVLARRADVIEPREAVRGWLHGVAVRTAKRTRVQYSRRRSREASVSSIPDPSINVETPIDSDVIRILDEEIGRLPDHLRAAVVLCELEGASRKVAAARLRIAEGTLSSRLAKARRRLGTQLRRRGVVLSSSGLATLFAIKAWAADIGLPLRDSTASLATSAPISASIAEISRGVLKNMFLNQLRRVSARLAMLAFIASAAVWGVYHVMAQTGQGQTKEVQAPKRTNRLFFEHGDICYSLAPDGTRERVIDLPVKGRGAVVASPDGKMLAYWMKFLDQPNQPAAICIWDLATNRTVSRIDLNERFGYIQFCWSPDGARIHLNLGGPQNPNVRHFLVDVKDKKLTKQNIMPHHIVTDWSKDGKCLLATGVGAGDFWQPRSLHLMNVDGTEKTALFQAKNIAIDGRLSPDGKRVLFNNDGRLSVLEIGKPDSVSPVEGIAESAEIGWSAWSPDGQQIAYTVGTMPFKTSTPDNVEELETRLVVASANGKNARALRIAKGKIIGFVDWR